MKCTACGMPLSPSRNNTNCPRCGTPFNVATKSPASQPGFEPGAWNGNAGAPTSVGAYPQARQWGQSGSSPSFQSPMVQTPAPQPGQMWAAGPNGTPRPGSQFPRQPAPGGPFRNTPVGFIVAGICVLMGGILLLVVFFLAMGQPGNNPTTAITNTPVSTHATSSPAVTPSPAVSPSPSATSFPGQQYISNAQMSSAQPSASQPVQPATTFKVNQTLYVAFNINSGGQGGEICLNWYLNGKSSFKYAFAVGARTTASYAQAIYGTPGSAYVELYWANNASCTNEVLAQHVDFTITA